MKWWKAAALMLGVVVAAAAVGIYALDAGWLGKPEYSGLVHPKPLPRSLVSAHQSVQRGAAEELGIVGDKQILFGDLHVHTTFSFDAFLLNLPILGGLGSHPPADACDFARFCSALDFWSINDHAENLTPRLWRETIDSVRKCNAVSGDHVNPDLVTYLGWEWSQIGSEPANHYGHKNVVLLGTNDDEIPTRPIAARSPGMGVPSGGRIFPLTVSATLGIAAGERGRDFNYLLSEVRETDRCPDGVPVYELPADCMESTSRPEELFQKLDEWGFRSLVIPHGTTWGIYTPAGSEWAKQLPGHDPARQKLVEIYSGHGNSEEYRDWRATERGPDASLICPAPTDDYLPSCWRSGELVRERCLEVGEAEEECEGRAVAARQHYVDAYQAGWLTVRGFQPNRWLDSGQCRDCFQPAFNYRPTGSAQYMLAVRDFDSAGRPKRFDFGFIGSSDNHTAKPGTGYKEFWRSEMTEGRGTDPENPPPSFLMPDPGDPPARSTAYARDGSGPRALGLFENERSTSFFVTGGLVAVHSAGRDRNSIFSALERKEVYATSGPRILLWFDLVEDADTLWPMGASVTLGSTPRFRVRAVGSFEPKPGCPEDAVATVGADRLEELCRGECYHPSDQRRRLSRVEIVRIRPQNRPDEPLDGLVEDPWRVLPCPPDASGCAVEFEDPEFLSSGRDAVYYARAIEEPSQAIHGSDPMGCVAGESGPCERIEPCNVRTPPSDECLSETEPRAWSSPIFVDHAAAVARGGP